MPLTVLYSVSLLALVVTARPIVQESPEFFIKRPQEIQSALQAVFESHTGSRPDCLECDSSDITIHLTSEEEQSEFLAQLDIEDVRAVLPLEQDAIPEKKLHDIITADSPSVANTSLEDLDGGERPLEEVLAEIAAEEGGSGEEVKEDEIARVEPPPTFSQGFEHLMTPQTLVLVLSCAASLLLLGCVAAAVYVAKLVRAGLLRNPSSWDVLEKAEKKATLNLEEGPLMSEEGGDQLDGRHGMFAQVTQLRLAELKEKEEDESDLSDDDQGGDGDNYLDADSTPTNGSVTPTPIQTPQQHPDPSLLPLPIVVDPEMRRIPGSFVDPHVDTSIDIDHPARAVYPMNVPARAERRAYGAPIPELDFAIARQMYRPFAQDGVWVVRLVVAMFGWFSVLVGGIN